MFYMWFNSFVFWLFFVIVASVYAVLSHRWQNRWLLVASYFFYGYCGWRFLALILACTWVNYFAAIRIADESRSQQRKGWVVAALVFSLGVLAAFKYFSFFAHEIGLLLSWLGIFEVNWVFHILLPAGISFFTFQNLSYTIDVYRRKTPATRDFADYALFISFFPLLLAGPIERSSHLLPQIQHPRPRCDAIRFQRGLFWIITGLFLKVVVADNMAWLANFVFKSPPASLHAPEVLVGIYAFTFQIYGDFAGYSSIAIGAACWLGFDLMTNFRRPYFATDPQMFWSRWHISLSTWLRDYLYIPLGGNRRGPWITRRNLLLTMLLGGLWHGAAWTYIVWGGLHGLWLVLHRSLAENKDGIRPCPMWLRFLKWLGTFHLICLTWLFFRADGFQQAIGMLQALGIGWAMTSYVQTSLTLILFFVGPWLLFEAWLEWKGRDEALLSSAWPWRAGLYGYMMLMLLFFPPPMVSEFLYFQF